MKHELLKGLVDILDRIDTLGDGLKPSSLEDFRHYFACVHAALDTRGKYYVIGDQDEIIVQPEFATNGTALVFPVPMILHCPECGQRHIDEGENATREHRTHACQVCGFLWAPAVVATVGVRFLPGCKDVGEA